MPLGKDPNTDDGVTAWVNSIHPKFAAMGLADKLLTEGYDTVLSVSMLDDEELRDEFDLNKGHAKLFAAASRAVCRTLGYTVSEVIQPSNPIAARSRRHVGGVAAQGGVVGSKQLWRGRGQRDPRAYEEPSHTY